MRVRELRCVWSRPVAGLSSPRMHTLKAAPSLVWAGNKTGLSAAALCLCVSSASSAEPAPLVLPLQRHTTPFESRVRCTLDPTLNSRTQLFASATVCKCCCWDRLKAVPAFCTQPSFDVDHWEVKCEHGSAYIRQKKGMKAWLLSCNKVLRKKGCGHPSKSCAPQECTAQELATHLHFHGCTSPGVPLSEIQGMMGHCVSVGCTHVANGHSEVLAGCRAGVRGASDGHCTMGSSLASRTCSTPLL